MAGYLDRAVDYVTDKLPQRFKNLANIGIKTDDLVLRQKSGIGRLEAEFHDLGYDLAGNDEEFLLALALADTKTRKNIPFFYQDYKERREKLVEFASNPEIEIILETICDEAIIYDDTNFFCHPKLETSTEISEEVKKKLEQRFKQIYTSFNFGQENSAWDYFFQWLVEGFLSFEIIWDNDQDPKEIIGFNELDPVSLKPIAKKGKDGRIVSMWEHKETGKYGGEKKVVMPDQKIIFISYSKANGGINRISYVERLVRYFNLMRSMENTTVGWHITNSQFRMKMIIPIGNKSTAKAKMALAKVMNKHKEDIEIHNDSGEITINGSAKINYSKQIVLPSRDGQEPDISAVAYDGPDLSDMSAAEYFYTKLKKASKVPFGRFDYNGGRGVVSLFSADGINQDELRFHNFIKRLKSEFQKILVKPLYLQMCIDFPELNDDKEFKSLLGLNYNSNNLFEKAKQFEIKEREINMIQSLESITEFDGTTPYFSKKFLMEKHFTMSQDDRDLNEKYKAEEKEALKKQKEEEAAANGGGEGTGENDLY